MHPPGWVRGAHDCQLVHPLNSPSPAPSPCASDAAEDLPANETESGGFDGASSEGSGASAEHLPVGNHVGSSSIDSDASEQERAVSPLGEPPTFPRRQPDGAPVSPMRRNESAAAQLQDAALPSFGSRGRSSLAEIRRNQSSNALSDLRMLESKDPSSRDTDRRDVIEAVVLQLHEFMLAAGGSTDAAEGASVRDAMQTYIETIVRQLELPNSCIVAMVIYVQRAVDDARFTLTVRNWQPCLLAAFVVAAKLSFDEPVWNEDFVKALRISNVQTSQISRWEADFLQLIKFNTNVALEQYSKVCFALQRVYEATHGKRLQFFTFLMLQARELEKARG